MILLKGWESLNRICDILKEENSVNLHKVSIKKNIWLIKFQLSIKSFLSDDQSGLSTRWKRRTINMQITEHFQQVQKTNQLDNSKEITNNHSRLLKQDCWWTRAFKMFHHTETQVTLEIFCVWDLWTRFYSAK